MIHQQQETSSTVHFPKVLTNTHHFYYQTNTQQTKVRLIATNHNEQVYTIGLSWGINLNTNDSINVIIDPTATEDRLGSRDNVSARKHEIQTDTVWFIEPLKYRMWIILWSFGILVLIYWTKNEPKISEQKTMQTGRNEKV